MCCTAPTLESTPVLPAGSRPAIDPQKLGALRGPLTPRVRAASLRGIEGLVACPLERAVAQEADIACIAEHPARKCAPVLSPSPPLVVNLEEFGALRWPPAPLVPRGALPEGKGAIRPKLALAKKKAGRREEGTEALAARPVRRPSPAASCAPPFPQEGRERGGKGL
eukprot:CAMPEP_0172044032 /NCGR_PEP_ID=MMETSP1041-20130122/26577_1 /TAXON_ID=464988 /ORGANISM="Hemiselmis andersenii, Strain CCMP439" /LENGTH=166 /DNA_ID=CAMNT_0012702493 /DNA_START=22 /DNA_END=520 /DNA_ORIENTATION=-